MRIEQTPSEYRWQTPFQKACAQGIRYGYNEVDRRYGPTNVDSLSYHGLGHTADVTERTVQILSRTRSVDPSLVSLDDIAFAALIASHHDLTQNFTFMDEGLDRVRVSDCMNTEARSFELLEQYMNQHEGIFGADDITFAGRALFATVCNRDPENGKITQPYIGQSMWAVQVSGRSTFIIPVLAMADLGDAGMSPNVIDRGNAMFRETYKGITTALATGINTLSEIERDFIREKMIEWAHGQIAFVRDRRRTFEEQCLLYFPQNIHSTVETLFPYFDYSEQETSERYALFTSDEGLSAMVESMGY